MSESWHWSVDLSDYIIVTMITMYHTLKVMSLSYSRRNILITMVHQDLLGALQYYDSIGVLYHHLLLLSSGRVCR